METENARLRKKLNSLEEEYKKLQDHISHIELKYQAALLKEGGDINEIEEDYRPSEDKLSTKLLRTVSDLFNNRLYSDVKIKLEDGSVMHGHKVILASRSTHWGLYDLNGVNTLDFTNISYEVIHDIMKWVYTDDIDLFEYKEDFLTELLEVTLRFQLTSLDIRCQKALISLIDENNCQKFMTLSNELCADLLKKFCKEFMSQAQIEDVSGVDELQFEEDNMSDEESLDADNISPVSESNSLHIDNTSTDKSPGGSNNSVGKVGDFLDTDNTLPNTDSISLDTDNTLPNTDSISLDTDNTLPNTDSISLDEGNNLANSDSLYAGNTSAETDSKSLDAGNTAFRSAVVENEANNNEVEAIEEVVEIDGEISLEYLPQAFIDTCSTEAVKHDSVPLLENGTGQEQKLEKLVETMKLSSEVKHEDVSELFEVKTEEIPSDDPNLDANFTIPNVSVRPTRKSPKNSIKSISANNISASSTDTSIETSIGYKSSLRSANIKRTTPIIKGQTCKICGKSYSYPAFRRHMRIHKGERRQKLVKCDVCSKYFRDKTALESHKRIHSKEKPFGCKHCEKAFRTKTELNSHIKTHNKQLVYSCKICEKTYTHPRSLKKHEKTHSPDNPNICDFCGKSLRDKSSLRDHRRLHTGERPYKCDVCGKNFPNNSGYKSHMMKHIGIKAFVCDICGKGYYSNNNLQAHIRLHTGEKPFKCEFCDKRFSSRRHLPRHERSHTGVRPYQCEKCGKAFTDGSSLLAHSKTHSGERPHHCEFCAKSFTQSSHLSKHLKSHLGEKDFECQVCFKRFFHKGHLDRHSRIHTGEKPYSCKVCEKSFARDDYLVKHMTIHVKHNDSIHSL